MRKTLLGLVALIGISCFGIGGCASANRNSYNFDEIKAEIYVNRELRSLVKYTNELDKACDIFDDVCLIPYVSDGTNSLGGELDIWKSPQRVLDEGGDCECLSSTFNWMLHEEGIIKGIISFGVFDSSKYPLDDKKRTDHVWVEYSYRNNTYLFDPSAKGSFIRGELRGPNPAPYYVRSLFNLSVQERVRKYREENNMSWMISNEYYENIEEREAILLDLPGTEKAK